MPEEHFGRDFYSDSPGCEVNANAPTATYELTERPTQTYTIAGIASASTHLREITSIVRAVCQVPLRRCWKRQSPDWRSAPL